MTGFGSWQLQLLPLATGLALIPLIAWIIMVAPRPWAHENPIANPLRAMQAAGRFNAQAQARPGRRCHMLIGGNPSLTEAASCYAAENIAAAYAGTTDGPPELPAHVDYYLAMSRFGAADKLSEASIVHRVGRTGAVFTVIRGRRPP